LKALNDHSTKFQALQTAFLQTGEAHPLKALIKVPTKYQALGLASLPIQGCG
jgi:hypothetical protein